MPVKHKIYIVFKIRYQYKIIITMPGSKKKRDLSEKRAGSI